MRENSNIILRKFQYTKNVVKTEGEENDFIFIGEHSAFSYHAST